MSFSIPSKTAWAIWAVLFIAYMYMGAIVMPGVMERINAVATDPTCAAILDLHLFGISEAQATDALTCMGEEGRAVYSIAETHEDIIYPFSYGFALSFSLFCLSGFLGFGKWRWLLAALPLICICFDFVENHHIHLLIQQYPTFDADTLRMASLGNTLKWSFAMPSIFGTLVLAVWALVKRVRR
jgi:hypothetical protein